MIYPCRRFSVPSLHSSIIPSNEETYKRGLPSTILVYWSCSKSTVRVFASFFFADVICFSFLFLLDTDYASDSSVASVASVRGNKSSLRRTKSTGNIAQTASLSKIRKV